MANGMPLAAIGAGDEVPPCCVTVISARACGQVAPSAETVMKPQIAVFGDSEDAAYMVTLAAVR